MLRLLLIWSIFLLAGCSHLPYFLGLELTGYRWDGTYTPYPAEKDYDCIALRMQIAAQEQALIGIDRRAATESQAKSSTLITGIWRFAAGASGLPAVREFENGVARLEALEVIHQGKNCPPRDRTQEFKNTYANMRIFIVNGQN